MQLELFTDLCTKPREGRTAYTMADFRATKEQYTSGRINGHAMARRLGRSYKSFKQFVKRNPELKKSTKGHQPES